jgi:assimilatory nitrate reductase catalytic subunit
VPELAAAEPEPFVEIHPDTARGLGIGNGDAVRLTSRRGHAEVQARVSRDIRADVLFVPFHWGGKATVNKLTNPELDPISRIPEFKICAVRIDRLPSETSHQTQNEDP